MEAIVGGETISEAIRSSIELMQKVIRVEIDRAALREALSDVHAMQLELREYLVAPNNDRLSSLTRTSLYVSSRLEQFDRNGHHAFLLAHGIHLFALQELARTDRRELGNILFAVQRGITVAERRESEWARWAPTTVHWNDTDRPFEGDSRDPTIVHQHVAISSLNRLWTIVERPDKNAGIRKARANATLETRRLYIQPSLDVRSE